MLSKYKELKNDPVMFKEFAIQNSMDLITQVLSNKEIDVCGLQFYTLNNLNAVSEVLKRIDRKNYFKNIPI